MLMPRAVTLTSSNKYVIALDNLRTAANGRRPPEQRCTLTTDRACCKLEVPFWSTAAKAWSCFTFVLYRLGD